MILIPMSGSDFDPTEAGIPWKILREAGIPMRFATPDGNPARPDERMLTGSGLGIWKKLLKAREDAVHACQDMMLSEEFRNPIPYNEIKPKGYLGVLVHGGHAPGMKQYLESEILQEILSSFMEDEKPVGAICHGVVLLSRAKNREGRSVLYGRRCTTLLKSQELTAYNLTKYWLGNYYRTYPDTTCEAEIKSRLANPSDFQPGPTPLLRDSPRHLDRGFTVRDRNLLTARWPGDAYRFSCEFLEMLK